MTIGLLLCFLFSEFYAFKSYIEFELQTHSDLKTVTRIYWVAEEDELYSSHDSSVVSVHRGASQYAVFLDDLANIKRIRFDPIEYAGRAALKRIRISQPGYATQEFGPEQLAQQLKPITGIYKTELSDQGFEVITTSRDSQFELALTPQKQGAFTLRYLITLALIMSISLVLHRALHGLNRTFVWIPACLLVVLVVVVVMGAISRFNTHPDESVHFEAVKYYSEHLLAPSLDDPEIEESFSSYGYTRLANYEVYYQLSGYYLAALQMLQVPDYLKARSFGWLLIAILLLLGARNKEFRHFLLPLLISAQAWYLFSYINSDGFGLFISIIVSYQVASRNSLLNNILQDKAPRFLVLSSIGLGLLLGTILVVKTNHYFFALFIGMYLLWRLWQGDFPDRGMLWKRALLIAVFAVIPYGLRLAMDINANGFSRSDRNEIKAAVIEKNADYLFKPSTPVDQRHIYLNLRQRGITVDEMVDRELWLDKMFYTAFGNYGYTQFAPIPSHFEILRTTGFLLLATMLLSILLRGPPASHWLLAITGLCSLALLVSLFLYSWSISFQPQGRYLASILPMLGVLYYEVRHYLANYLFYLLIFTMMLMGLYSFVMVGMGAIAKVDYRFFMHDSL